jgi:hypothetical protein
MVWFQRRWWYVEHPFPWLQLLVCTVPFVIIGFAVALGIWWFQ